MERAKKQMAEFAVLYKFSAGNCITSACKQQLLIKVVGELIRMAVNAKICAIILNINFKNTLHAIIDDTHKVLNERILTQRCNPVI